MDSSYKLTDASASGACCGKIWSRRVNMPVATATTVLSVINQMFVRREIRREPSRPWAFGVS